MKKTDVLIIGGSAAGLVTAVTGKSTYPEKDFLLIRKVVLMTVLDQLNKMRGYTQGVPDTKTNLFAGHPPIFMG